MYAYFENQISIILLTLKLRFKIIVIIEDKTHPSTEKAATLDLSTNKSGKTWTATN